MRRQPVLSQSLNFPHFTETEILPRRVNFPLPVSILSQKNVGIHCIKLVSEFYWQRLKNQ
jgi:hypothetical protein